MYQTEAGMLTWMCYEKLTREKRSFLKKNILKKDLGESVTIHCAVLSQSVVSDSVTFWTLWSLQGSSVHGIFQARILAWVAIPISEV